MKEKIENIIFNKKFMVGVACFLIIFSVCYAFIYFNFNNTVTNKECVGSLRYLISEKGNLYNEIFLDMKESTKLYNEIDVKGLKKIDKLELLSENIVLELCDLKIFIMGEENLVNYKNNFYTLGKNKDIVYDFIEEKINNYKGITLYKYEKDSYKPYLVSGENAKKIRSFIDYLELSPFDIDLHIEGDFLLYVDGKSIVFDEVGSYASIGDKLFIMDSEFSSVINDVLSVKNDLSDRDCCSCCPDLKPGESCIAVCCPCKK